MCCSNCYSPKFSRGLIVTVGNYGSVLWRVVSDTPDGVTLANHFPVAGSPRTIVVPNERVKPWSGNPRPVRVSRQIASVLR